MDVIGSPVIRAEVLRVLHRLTLGMPDLTPDDLAGQPLSPAEKGLLNTAGQEDLALLNALIEVEREALAAEFSALERLLAHAQFEDGDLDARVSALPERAFARAASALYALGWVDR